MVICVKEIICNIRDHRHGNNGNQTDKNKHYKSVTLVVMDPQFVLLVLQLTTNLSVEYCCDSILLHCMF